MILEAFDLDLHDTQSLSEEEKLLLLRLVASGAMSETQAAGALDAHRRLRVSLREILATSGVLQARDYASNLAVVTQSADASELAGSDVLDVDQAFVREFQLADLMRHLFCPIQRVGEMVIVLSVEPLDPPIETILRAVLPDCEITTLIASEPVVRNLIDSAFLDDVLSDAIDELKDEAPEQSAARVFVTSQKVMGVVLIAVLLAGILVDARGTLMLALLALSAIYVASISFKLIVSFVGILPQNPDATTPSPQRLRDDELPLYSILVPVYHEPEVVPRLLAALGRLDYPPEKLDVLILMEADDRETIDAAVAANPPSFFRFIYVPESHPRTKPKACNFGLAFCRGEFVTIYDAEDVPEPGQLRAAVQAFRNGPESLVCVQAALNYFNDRENYLTRMFTLEYTYWFDCMLPGLARLGLPIPLGGTSNHFRLDRLRELRAWDPFNVTEDADLGIRAAALGYTVGIVPSTTYEEANNAWKNWLRQRSRWVKGYMQTWLVHNRHPGRLIQAIGLKQWLSYQLLIGGTVLVFLINPIMWGMMVLWLLYQPRFITDVFQGPLLYASIANFLIGNFLGIYLNLIGVFRRELFHLGPFALTNPLYWTLHSVAAYIALWQLFTKPFYWEKTDHALTSVQHDVLPAESARVSASVNVAP
ncbi:MAG: glycosyltransferase family 2 protein [Chloroflexota bacterium]